MAKPNTPAAKKVKLSEQGKVAGKIVGDASVFVPNPKVENVPDSFDLTFGWLVRDHGIQWEAWRAHIEAYLRTRDEGLSVDIQAIRAFTLRYLLHLNVPAEPDWFLSRRNVVPAVSPTLKTKATISTRVIIKRSNVIVRFIDWLLLEHYSLPDDYGRKVVASEFHNPVAPMSARRGETPTESVRSALPFAYLQRLRQILAPGRHFRDWAWAHRALGIALDNDGRSVGSGGRTGDWIQVDPAVIDRDDPDCVWRTRTLQNNFSQGASNPIAVTEIWSPVRSVALLTKLHLPLRTYQVRMLDSGEADTWRYQTTGRAGSIDSPRGAGELPPLAWTINSGPLATGDDHHPVQQGVFRRIEDREHRAILTGFYINTNKTGDAQEIGDAKGYVIPWEHEELLYWLEKLRNWQIKYNPISGPTPWASLGLKHLRAAKSAADLARHSDTCFLFRDASARGEDRKKPLSFYALDRLWYLLLAAIEAEERSKGQTYKNGAQIRFVSDQSGNSKSRDYSTTLFPLHSLRVSLLTCLALDGGVPLPVLSKLVAGHSRLIMTLYYIKIGPLRLAEELAQARQKLIDNAPESMRRFLAEASFEEMAKQLATLDVDAMRSAVGDHPGDRVPGGWMPMPYGWCLAGGNVGPSEANAKVPGCHNGGKQVAGTNYSGAVHGGPRNCTACRWFVTGPQFLDQLVRRFNQLSLQLSDATETMLALEVKRDALNDARYDAINSTMPWTGEAELRELTARYEKSATIVDGFGITLAHTYRIVLRCYALLEEAIDGQQSLVAAGDRGDVKIALSEVDSRMLQIHRVCMDAEIQPDIEPGEVLFVRSEMIDNALMRDGHGPVMLTLTKDQKLRVGNRLIDQLGEQLNPEHPVLGQEVVLRAIENGGSLAKLGLGSVLQGIQNLGKQPSLRVSDYKPKPKARRALKTSAEE